MTIKAIETRYAGCRFRSRLEARWAVFFDAMKIEWQYEPQGFELPSGNYLPDFYLPEQDTFPVPYWIEVKGKIADRREIDLLEELSEVVYGLVGLLQGDIPRSPNCRVSTVPPTDALKIPLFCLKSFGSRDKHWTDSIWMYRSDLQQALITARSARFEHGEQG